MGTNETQYLKEVISVLPQGLLSEITENINNINGLQEIRAKVNKPLMLVSDNIEFISKYYVTAEDIKNIMHRISNYSLYAFEEEIKQGYITIRGGHRVGICGKCVMEKDVVKTIKNISSINIRICKEVIGCSNKIIGHIFKESNVFNTIIISPPRCGKTTLLRDISRNISDGMEAKGLKGKKVCIIDERSELAACYEGIPQKNVGIRTDVLDGCLKSEGIMMAIRSMAPEVVICDEIGTTEDMRSIVSALNCGINLITSIHGLDIEDLYKRKVFNPLLENYVFQKAIVLSNKKGICTIDYIYDFNLKDYVWRG
jgi:stage III sporulation protein AA